LAGIKKTSFAAHANPSFRYVGEDHTMKVWSLCLVSKVTAGKNECKDQDDQEQQTLAGIKEVIVGAS